MRFSVGLLTSGLMIFYLVQALEGKPKPKPVDPAHFRVCVRSDAQGKSCSRRLWSMEDAQMIEQMFLQAPIPCPYDVGIQDMSKEPDSVKPVVPQVDHSNETKVKWQ